MAKENEDEIQNDLEKMMSFIKDVSESKLMDDQFVSNLVASIMAAREENVAKSFNSIEIGVIMLTSGYLLDPKLKGHSTFTLLQGIFSKKGIDFIVLDMRENGMEVSFDQVHEAMDKVFSYVLEFGLASLHKGMLTAGVDCSPPASKKLNFEDMGIKDPFKEN